MSDSEYAGPSGSVLLPIQTDIGTWARKTFPSATKESWVAHLRREVEELGESHAPNEAADCLILLFGHAHINGYDLLASALAKMEVNRARTWGKPDAEGVVEHVEPNDQSHGSAAPADTVDSLVGRPCPHCHAQPGALYWSGTVSPENRTPRSPYQLRCYECGKVATPNER